MDLNTDTSLHLADTYISIPLGIIIGLLASFVQSLGLTIQRKSHVLNQRLPEDEQIVEHRRPLWLLGFAVFISSNVLGSLVQIASLPVVILAPLGAVSLLWNAFFARILLGDVFSPWMILGTFLIAGGAILIAVFGIVPEPTHSLEDLLYLFRRPAFVAYFSILGSVVFIALLVSHIVEYSVAKRSKLYDTPLVATTPTVPVVPVPENPSSLTTGVTNTISEGMATERTPLIPRGKSRKLSTASSVSSAVSLSTPSTQRTRLLLAVSYASFSGILSGMCLIFAKSGVELLVLTLRGHNQFWRWESWILLLGLVVFALLQLWYLHKALILANPTLVCPSAFCFYNISSIVNGLIYFDQFSAIPPLHLGLVGLGMGILLSGVWVVSIQSDTADDGEWSDTDSSDEEVPLSPHPTAILDTNREQTNEPVIETTVDDLVKPDSDISESRQTIPRITTTAHSIGLGRPPRRPLSETQSQRREDVTPISPSVSSMSHPSSRPHREHRRRPTIDTISPFLNVGQSQRHPPNASHTSPPLNAVSTLGTGFQIGLSPMSPGFSIVPRERHRRISGLRRDNSIEREDGDRRRRTVSEGDFRHHLFTAPDPDDPPLNAGDAVGEVTPDIGMTEAGVNPNKGHRPAKDRWKWLAGLFTRRQA
ncbi:hypothetical protein ONZ45_g878 [Pleurotus djamor]|nr:hypothetical protein ONZ45_g878 [Pleurotus djamor]